MMISKSSKMSLFEGIFIIDAAADNTALIEVAKEIFSSLDEIKEVHLNVDDGVATSAVFALLASIKKTAPHIRVPLLDDGVCDIEGIGALLLDIRG